jgi:MoaA/NifB/PqqE/SkfB family radical SAM enzyme
MSNLSTYLSDPILANLYQEVRKAGAVKSISVDLTHECNLRCKGCYYFEEGMDKIVDTASNLDIAFEEFLASEKERGTNFITIVGGEPSLRLDRLKMVYDAFKMNVATNGLIKIPYEGFENMPIGVAVWGSNETDAELRNKGKRDLFSIALENYKDDSRAFFYYTVSPDKSDEIASVVEMCVNNGNKVLFNYFSDTHNKKNITDYRAGFENVRIEIEKAIRNYPGHILTTSYFNQVITTGQLYDQHWGYDVCTNVSTNFEPNQGRLQNGNPFNPHFRSYNADFKTTRRCCTGIDRSCDSCCDAWEHFSWILINMKKHLGSKQEFTNWLTSMYIFYYINRIITEETVELQEIHLLLKLNTFLNV